MAARPLTKGRPVRDQVTRDEWQKRGWTDNVHIP